MRIALPECRFDSLPPPRWRSNALFLLAALTKGANDDLKLGYCIHCGQANITCINAQKDGTMTHYSIAKQGECGPLIIDDVEIPEPNWKADAGLCLPVPRRLLRTSGTAARGRGRLLSGCSGRTTTGPRSR